MTFLSAALSVGASDDLRITNLLAPLLLLLLLPLPLPLLSLLWLWLFPVAVIWRCCRFSASCSNRSSCDARLGPVTMRPAGMRSPLQRHTGCMSLAEIFSKRQ